MSAEMMQAKGYLESIHRMEENTNWKELEELDPTDALLKRDEFRRAKEEVADQIGQLQIKQNDARRAYLQQASTKMVELIPTWKDSAAKEADFSTIITHMVSSGFSEAEAKSVADPRTMFLLKELIDLRAEKSKATTALKKVNKAPKVLSGSRGLTKPNASDETNKMVKKAQQSGNKHDELNAVKSLLRTRR